MNESPLRQFSPHTADTLPTGLVSAQGVDLERFETLNTHVQTWTTPAGAGVNFVEAHGLPIVDLVLRFRAGTCQDTALPGLAALTLYMLDEGSQQHDAAQQAAHIERLGVVVSKEIRLEHATLSLRSVSSQALLEPAVALFTDLVARPAFLPEALEKVKGQLRQQAASRERRPASRVRLEVFRQLFGGHPYGTPLGSSAAGIEATTAADLQQFHRRAYCASNLEITLVGDLTREQAQAITQQISQALPQGWAAAELPTVPQGNAATLHVEHPGVSTSVTLALPMSVPANHPDYLALALASEVLGAGIDSRLMRELRQRRGLTYDIRTRLSPLQAGGLFSIAWDIAPEHVAASHAVVLATLQHFIDQGPTDAELRLARQQLAGSLLRSVARNHTLAALITEITYQRQPGDHLNTYMARIAQLTPAMLREAMQRGLDMSRQALVSVGPSVDQQPLPVPPATDQ
ncbi:insulinase family protein [Pantoea sp. Tr-811]|uniref:M16 family metallopeptidase n=1 Tax=Pantoea sp. Tr-811 TaxID=2608361 RepID=UPI00141F95B6|nr:pitrilysin family protein [Pantoea sp. Tr-811]NIF25618.1 insulinase family protein [Pantoea sp. Tr-811]